MTVSEKPTMERTVIGLMSGTSMDGIDAALIRTDGRRVTGRGPSVTIAYDGDQRRMIQAALSEAACLPGAVDVPAGFDELGKALAEWHAVAVNAVLNDAGLTPGGLDAIGFHGHTVFHAPRPDQGPGYTWQAGDGEVLARLTGVPVVFDFRSADVAAGGEGAPLAPAYHAALLGSNGDGLVGPSSWPVAILNLGGVGNVTYIETPDRPEDILAFDTGPANALIDEWVEEKGHGAFDTGGELSSRGRVHEGLVQAALRHPYFDRPAPKSLDRLELQALVADPAWRELGLEDGAATRAALTAASVAAARDHLPGTSANWPAAWYVTGGGRHNATLMAMLRDRLGVPVEPVEALGWRGDCLEAEAFAYLAVRSLDGLPVSFPGTTGVRVPLTSGRTCFPPAPARAQAAS
jgi:anhydro-N-acetylmuramic acid kinase